MAAEALVDLLVAALAGEVEVEVADGRREAIGVGCRHRDAVGVARLDLIGQRRRDAIQARDPQARGMHELAAVVHPARDVDDDVLGARPPRADSRATVAVGVRAEQRVRVGQLAGDQRRGVSLPGLGEALVLHRVAHASGSVDSGSSRRAIPATGILTQSGRLSSS